MKKIRSPRIILSFLSFICLFSLPVYADFPFRDHRYNSFKTLEPNKEGDIIFIGNSITNMMNWNELFGGNPNIKNRGTSGAFTQEILNNLESMIAGNPSKIFLMIGTNDLGSEGSFYTPDAVAYRIKKILERIREERPEAEVYFQSILPSNAGLRTVEKIETVNKDIEEWIKSNPGYKINYVDLYSLLFENGDLKNTVKAPLEDNFSFDGLHLTWKGYQAWANAIKDLVGYEPVGNDDCINLWGDLRSSNGMRTTYFGVFPIEDNDILLLGDELINGGEWAELLGSSDFKNRGFGWGFPGVSIENISSIIDPVFKGNKDRGITKNNPKATVLYMGVSNILKGDSISAIKSKYREIITEIKDAAPYTKIFIMTLAPLGSDKENLAPLVKDLNNELFALQKEEEGVSMIDLYSALLDGDERNEMFFTGKASPYLNGFGYSIAAETIAEAVNKELGTSYTALNYNNALENLNRYNNLTDLYNKSYIVFDNANSVVPYRIPAIAKSKDGNLIAVSDYRYSKADIGMAKNGKLDLRYRIKDAATGKWGDVKTLAAARGEGETNFAFGDPCIVADRESERILVTSCNGNVSFPKGTAENHQGIAAFWSEDGGKTWSEYIEIGNQFAELLNKRSDGPVNAFFIGSGKISQSSKIKAGDFYRIYCAALVRINDGKTKVNYVFYSDDFGKNWNLLGDIDDCPIPYGADEPKTEELPDGSVLISSRISGGRFYNVFDYQDVAEGKGKWLEMATSDATVNGIKASSNACNGETLLVPVIRNSDGEETYLLLQSVPMNTEGRRANVGINYKDLKSLDNIYTPANIARDWDGYYEVSPYSSGYSTMTLDKETGIEFLFEENNYNGGYDIIYRNLSLDDITNGKYIFRNN